MITTTVNALLNTYTGSQCLELKTSKAHGDEEFPIHECIAAVGVKNTLHLLIDVDDDDIPGLDKKTPSGNSPFFRGH